MWRRYANYPEEAISFWGEMTERRQNECCVTFYPMVSLGVNYTADVRVPQ